MCLSHTDYAITKCDALILIVWLINERQRFEKGNLLSCGLRQRLMHYLYIRVIRPAIKYGGHWSGGLIPKNPLQSTGGLRSTPSLSMEELLNLPSLDIFVRSEARM